MAFEFYKDPFEKPALLLVSLAVFSVRAVLAIRTAKTLKAITREVIPFAPRTIWLIKILALLVAAPGVFESFQNFGLPWYLLVSRRPASSTDRLLRAEGKRCRN